MSDLVYSDEQRTTKEYEGWVQYYIFKYSACNRVNFGSGMSDCAYRTKCQEGVGRMKESELHAETTLQNFVRLASDGKWDKKVYIMTTHKDFHCGKWQFGNS